MAFCCVLVCFCCMKRGEVIYPFPLSPDLLHYLWRSRLCIVTTIYSYFGFCFYLQSVFGVDLINNSTIYRIWGLLWWERRRRSVIDDIGFISNDMWWYLMYWGRGIVDVWFFWIRFLWPHRSKFDHRSICIPMIWLLCSLGICFAVWCYCLYGEFAFSSFKDELI